MYIPIFVLELEFLQPPHAAPMSTVETLSGKCCLLVGGHMCVWPAYVCAHMYGCQHMHTPTGVPIPSPSESPHCWKSVTGQ